MINKAIIMGRITRDLELKQTPNGVSVVQFTVAVERAYAKQGQEREVDFISCVAWRQTAEFICKYFGKGRMIALEGSMRTRTYEDKNGTKHYLTELYADNVSFTGEKKEEGTFSQNYGNNGNQNNQGYAGGTNYQANNTTGNASYANGGTAQNNASQTAPQQTNQGYGGQNSYNNNDYQNTTTYDQSYLNDFETFF